VRRPDKQVAPPAWIRKTGSDWNSF